jgi:hypothetical protein
MYLDLLTPLADFLRHRTCHDDNLSVAETRLYRFRILVQRSPIRSVTGAIKSRTQCSCAMLACCTRARQCVYVSWYVTGPIEIDGSLNSRRSLRPVLSMDMWIVE